jgi:methyl-accepting chemotaxis protein
MKSKQLILALFTLVFLSLSYCAYNVTSFTKNFQNLGASSLSFTENLNKLQAIENNLIAALSLAHNHLINIEQSDSVNELKRLAAISQNTSDQLNSIAFLSIEDNSKKFSLLKLQADRFLVVARISIENNTNVDDQKRFQALSEVNNEYLLTINALNALQSPLSNLLANNAQMFANIYSLYGHREVTLIVCTIILFLMASGFMVVQLSSLYRELKVFVTTLDKYNTLTPQFTNKEISEAYYAAIDYRDKELLFTEIIEKCPVGIIVTNAFNEVLLTNAKAIYTLQELENVIATSLTTLMGQRLDEVFAGYPEIHKALLVESENTSLRQDIGSATISFNIKTFNFQSNTLKFIIINNRTKLNSFPVNFEKNIKSLLSQCSYSAENLQKAAKDMLSTASINQSEIGNTKGFCGKALESINIAGKLVADLTLSLEEISGHIINTSNISAEAVNTASQMTASITNLGGKAEKVNEVIELITSIASQINLLALNANIEAARAGEAGKGFTVVAKGVKALAEQTTKASEEVSRQIRDIHLAITKVVEEIVQIFKVVQEVSNSSSFLTKTIHDKSANNTLTAQLVLDASQKLSSVYEQITAIDSKADEGTSDNKKLQAIASQLFDALKNIEAKSIDYLIDLKEYSQNKD